MNLSPNYIDISPRISESTPVFPGDQAFSRQISMSFEQGDHLRLSSFTTTPHIGAHTDAPNHYTPDGCDMADRSLDFYVGAAQVIDVSDLSLKEISWDLVNDRRQAEIKTHPRLLFKTNTFPAEGPWQNAFASFSVSAISEMAGAGAKLIGIDTPSVDPADSKSLAAHREIARCDLAILEGVDLRKVIEGCYFLVAAPLPLVGADASPVRALLFK